MAKNSNRPLVVITGTELRHQYFIRKILELIPIRCAYIEERIYPNVRFKSESLRSSWEWFFQRRQFYEENNFSDNYPYSNAKVDEWLNVPQGNINSEGIKRHLKKIDPGLIAIFDSSMIDEETLQMFPDRILNLHLGISSEYRGSSCHFWPIHDGRLDCLGATIMKINRGVDSGDIVLQKRISLKRDDNEQELMGKVIILGVELMVQTIDQWQKGALSSTPLNQPGKLYFKKYFSPEAVDRVKRWVETNGLK